MIQYLASRTDWGTTGCHGPFQVAGAEAENPEEPERPTLDQGPRFSLVDIWLIYGLVDMVEP